MKQSTMSAVKAQAGAMGWLAAGFLGLTVTVPAWASPPAKLVVVTRNSGFLQMIEQADPIVKMILLLLVAASVGSWAIWISKTIQLSKARRTLSNDVATLWSSTAFDAIENVRYEPLQTMSNLAKCELDRVGPRPSDHVIQGVEERVGALLSICERKTVHEMLTGTNILASIGATAPFVGLTGTVWGIMNSFLGIAASRSTSLAVVAPGLAEALFTTAVGLAAAIPAVLLYNNLVRGIAGFRQLLSSSERLIVCAISREARRRGDGGPVSTVVGESEPTRPSTGATGPALSPVLARS